jgi:hypothetical protein
VNQTRTQWPHLLVHDVGEDILFAALALDDLGALGTGLDNLLGEGVCIGGRVVDQRTYNVKHVVSGCKVHEICY